MDPAWLHQTAPDTSSDMPPVSGLQARSSSGLALRSPLQAVWNETEIVQVFSGSVATESLRWTNWARTSLSCDRRSFATSDFAIASASSQAGWSAGTRLASEHVSAAVGFEEETGRHGFNGALTLSQGRASLVADLAKGYRGADLVVSTSNGELSTRWNDVADSLAATLRLPLGIFEWTTRAWHTEAASSGKQDLVDTGTSSGWAMDASMPTNFGTWALGCQRGRSDLRTIGSRSGRVFHDQDWRTVRVGVDASWKNPLWYVRGSTRQVRLELPFGGLARPFVHWNMIPDDVFGRIAGVLEDRSEFLEGSFRIESWNLRAGRTWSWKSVSLLPTVGASWTGFDALLKRSTLEVRGLFPMISESTPCDGAGWIAMADASMFLEWKTSGLGTLRAGGEWRQPLAGGWNSRLPEEASSSNTPPTSSSGSANPVDPAGFHSWSFDWLLAL